MAPLLFLARLLATAALAVLNLVLPATAPRPAAPAHSFRAPAPGDSRSPCPALNALANHALLPRTGKSIPLPLLASVVHSAYNFACR